MPFVYWLTVVVVSVTGTLYTDILTDDLRRSARTEHQRLRGGPGRRLRRVVGPRADPVDPQHRHDCRESCSTGSAILVTFALGTAAGDWILELTGWGPGTSVLLPAGLIVAVVIGWRLGANAVLSFWLAYILTRPLGANLGDWLGFPPDQQGLGLGTAVTSVIFLTAILATVIYLTAHPQRRHRDDRSGPKRPIGPPTPARERVMLGYYAVVAVAAGALLVWAAGQPHSTAAASEEESGSSATCDHWRPGSRRPRKFPPAEMAKFRTITQDTLAKVQAGDQTGATARIKDLETAWDDDQATLQPLDDTGWTVLDGQIDDVLTALRADNPDPATETADSHRAIDVPEVRQP